MPSALIIAALILSVGSIIMCIFNFIQNEDVKIKLDLCNQGIDDDLEAHLLVVNDLFNAIEKLEKIQKSLDKYEKSLDNTQCKKAETKETTMACKRGGAKKAAPKKSTGKKPARKATRK